MTDEREKELLARIAELEKEVESMKKKDAYADTYLFHLPQEPYD
jgi:uncharacterized coiled-coil DUF342 family protein